MHEGWSDRRIRARTPAAENLLHEAQIEQKIPAGIPIRVFKEPIARPGEASSLSSRAGTVSKPNDPRLELAQGTIPRLRKKAGKTTGVTSGDKNLRVSHPSGVPCEIRRAYSSALETVSFSFSVLAFRS